ncbi:hypothetical protein Tco_0392463 [Tanacetum coccineum]
MCLHATSPPDTKARTSSASPISKCQKQCIVTVVQPKFDMPSYKSEMTSKDVKSLALRHGIPLDLHPVALTKGWTMDQLPDDMIGLYEQYFEFSGIRVPFSTFLLAVIKHFHVHISQLVLLGLNRLTMFELYCRSLEEGWRAIPNAMVWRHHDSDVNDPVPEDGFQASDVLLLTEQVIDLRPVPSGLLFYGGLATTWDFPGFHLIFKDTEGNVITMSEYLRFPFMSGASISKGPPLTSQDQIEQHTARPLLTDQPIPEKTTRQKEVEVEDPKIVAARERKARATAKKRERKHQGSDGGEGSRPATKRKKTSARRDGTGAFEATPSPAPIRTINPNKPSAAVAKTAESREDRSPCESPHASADHSVHNYSDAHQGNRGAGLQLETSGRAITHVDTEVAQTTPSPWNTFHSNAEAGESSRRSSLYVPDWSIPQRCRLDTPMWCRELMTHLAPPAAQEESNALNNPTALERAWFALARGALAQTDILERFETLQANFDELAESHAECGDWAGKLVQARLDVKHSSDLYNSLSDRFKAFRSEHEGCSGRLEASESRNRELSQVNKDQALRIKELEDTLARKDSALVYAERLNVERAQEKEKLSHEDKQSLSGPFNLAIQAGWGKGLAEERSEEDLIELMGRMEGFDVHVDTKMKVYPDSPPSEQAPLASALNQPQD